MNANDTIVGYINRLWYLYCTECYAKRTSEPEGAPVYADTAPHNTENCDACEKPLTRNWYVIPHTITDADDYSAMRIALVAASTRSKACKRFEAFALDGDETLWGKPIIDAYDGSSFERADEGCYYNCRPCDCGELGCESDQHDSLTVTLTWNTSVPVTECATLDAAREAAQREYPHNTAEVFE